MLGNILAIECGGGGREAGLEQGGKKKQKKKTRVVQIGKIDFEVSGSQGKNRQSERCIRMKLQFRTREQTQDCTDD